MGGRRDVQRNRALLVEAATQVFRESGATAPLDLVVQRAGVGRATLYRHFPDRGELIAAVLARQFELLQDYAAAHPGPELLEQVMVEICWFQADAPGLVPAIRDLAGPARHLEGLLVGMQRLLSEALEQAARAGTVRPGTTLADLFLTIAMLDGVIAVQGSSPVAAPVQRALELALRSLRVEGSSDRPVPRSALRSPA